MSFSYFILTKIIRQIAEYQCNISDHYLRFDGFFPCSCLLFFTLFIKFLHFLKPLKDELVVARNRFLAESMLGGVQNPKRKYSVPTCHTTLKQLEQSRLAREFEQQRSKKQEQSNNNINNNNNNNNNNKFNDDDVLPRRTLSRTTSVGKLVSNFENGTIKNDDTTTDEDDQESMILMRHKPPLPTKPVLRHTVSF
jgi:hypothetical protein